MNREELDTLGRIVPLITTLGFAIETMERDYGSPQMSISVTASHIAEHLQSLVDKWEAEFQSSRQSQ